MEMESFRIKSLTIAARVFILDVCGGHADFLLVDLKFFAKQLSKLPQNLSDGVYSSLHIESEKLNLTFGTIIYHWKLLLKFKSSRPDVFLGKGVLKICSMFTGEHPCWSVISIKYSSLGGCFKKFKKNTLVKCNQHRKPQWLNVFALNHFMSGNSELQKQPPRGVPRKKCSENIQQIYRKTPMLKCNFNKALELYWNHTSAWVFSCKFPAYFQCTFSSEHL